MPLLAVCICCLHRGPHALGLWSGLRKCRDGVEVKALPVFGLGLSPPLLHAPASCFGSPISSHRGLSIPVQLSRWEFSECLTPLPSSCPEGPCLERHYPSSALSAGQSDLSPPQRSTRLGEYPCPFGRNGGAELRDAGPPGCTMRRAVGCPGGSLGRWGASAWGEGTRSGPQPGMQEGGGKAMGCRGLPPGRSLCPG